MAKGRELKETANEIVKMMAMKITQIGVSL
jgi:hypothetical protein